MRIGREEVWKIGKSKQRPNRTTHSFMYPDKNYRRIKNVSYII